VRFALGLVILGNSLSCGSEVRMLSTPDVLEVSDDPDLAPADKRGPGLWNPLSSNYHAYERLHAPVELNFDDDDDEDKLNGEVAAVGILAGQKLIPGTVDTVRFVDHRVAAQQIPDKGPSLGEDSEPPPVRKDSLLLAKGSFKLEAASREDGPDGEERTFARAQSLLQLGETQGNIFKTEDGQNDPAMEHSAADAAQHMQLDDEEASMVADTVEGKLRDVGETSEEKEKDRLPFFPVGEPGGGLRPVCKDKAYTYICQHWRKEGKCNIPENSKQCLLTCERCGQHENFSKNGHFAAPKPKNPEDCVVAPWEWSSCTDSMNGEFAASRKITQQPKPHGVPCPSTTTKQKCNSGGCHAACKTCNGKTDMDCLSCYDSRESVLNAIRITNDKNMSWAWKPSSRRHDMLFGEGGYQFKMLNLKKMTGQCVWDGDIRTQPMVSADGTSKCEVGCDPPARMGNFTPGFVCTKSCMKSTWSFVDLPAFNATTGTMNDHVTTGKAANPSCELKKSLSCSPDREKNSLEVFTGDSAMKCTTRKSGRCSGVRYGTYKMHRTSKTLGAGRVEFLQREFNTLVANTCMYDPQMDDYKQCQLRAGMSEADQIIANQRNPDGSDKGFILSVMGKAFEEGWSPLVLSDGYYYFVKFELDGEDTTTYGCLHNDGCQQLAALN